MGRPLWYLTWVVAIFAVLGGTHYYVWARMVRDTFLPSPWARAGTLLLLAGATSIPMAMLMSRTARADWTAPLYGAAFTWLAVALMLVVLFAAADLLRLVVSAGLWAMAALRGTAEPVDPSRRLFIARAVAGAAGAVVTTATAVGLKGTLGEVEVREVPVKLPRLPKALAGLTIVQLTDIHAGPTIGRRFIEGVVEKTKAARPDVVVITGDLVDADVPTLRPALEPLTQLHPRFGTYFVTGNHEYYLGVDAWTEEISRMGIHVLANERVSVGDSGASIDLAGVPDFTASTFGHVRPDLAAALAGRDPERELLLLAHQPKAIDQAARLGVGLQLSGHTHGGQIWPFGAVVALTQPYVAGLHRHGAAAIYVSCGTGYWGPPLRVLVPAEITKVVLV